MRMRSVMRHKFSEVPSVEIPRSTFKRDHGLKTTFDAGYLVPIFLDEALPGDTFKLNMTGFARLSTPIYPIMDNMRMSTFFFAVPYRLLWENWQRFCGERDPDPDSSIDYTIPIIDDLINPSNETIWDYFGLPTLINATYEFSALPLRAYNLIWNQFFRDQNLQDSVPVNIDDGPDTYADYELLRRSKRHDYFTSCLPWLQKGDSVQLSLGDYAPVTGIGKQTQTYSFSSQAVYETDGTGTTTYADSHMIDAGTDYQHYVEEDPDNAGFPNIKADLSNAMASTVNELREAIQTQRLLEKDARAGTRYTEIIKSHFGVTSEDYRLQRPEYLGGGSSPVNITPIARTDSSPGSLGAMGVAAFKNHGFIKSFTEHCLIIGLVSVSADLTYQEGLDRMWSRQTRFDFYWPTFAHLGEQAVLNKEIYLDATTIGDSSCDDVFGYQERFAEYRYKPSKITGKFRSNDPATLDAWHLGIEFGSQPTLDDTFIEDVPPIDRVIATPTEPHFIFDSFVNLNCARPMPIYSVPGLVDHF